MFEDTPEELLPMVSESELYGQPSARQQDYQITDEQVEEVKSKLQNYRQKANNTYEQWEPTIISRYEKYQADPEYYARIFPRLSKLSSYTERDIANTIEWALPSIVDAFIATDDICDIKGVTAEDDHNAYVMKMLINYQLNKKNNSMQLIYNWAKDALILGIGLVKVQWLREEAIIEASEFMNQQSLMMAMQQGMEITGVQEAGPDTYNVFYNKPATIKNQPLIENLKFSEFRFLDGYKDLTACPFVAHVKQMTKSDLREKEKSGMYSNVSEAIDNATPNQQQTQLDTLITTSYNRVTDVMGSRNFAEESMNNVEVWESFVKIDIDGDGIAENWIITTVNDVIIRSERNVYGRHPFFILSPFDDPHTLIANQSYADIIGPIQDAKTALMKQLLNNIAQTNDPKTVIDEQAINIGDLITGKQYIRKKQGVDMNNAFQQFPVAPMHQATLAMYELLSGNNENRTGITRYNQGLDANTLNKMLALDTPIPMIDGSYKLNKDIVIGDKLIGSDGNVVTVTMAHPIQNPERAFEITFANGEVIKSGGEHRWSVKVCDKYYRNKSEEFEKLPTDRIFDLVNSGHKVYIPQSNYVNFTTKELPIDPYVFGAYLGDGHSYSNRFTSMDKEVIDAFSNWAEENGGYLQESSHQNSGQAKTYNIINTPFRELLKDLNCVKDNRYEDMLENRKHIPEIYLTGDFEQRLSLLRGLMDTDGCITSKGTCIFSNSNEELIYNFEKLVISLGGYTNIQWQQPKKGELAGRVYFSIAHCPVTIGYKVDRWKKRKDTDKLKITYIKEIAIEPMRCLTVDAQDELYCCGNKFTLTSNTATGISAIMSASNQRLKLIVRLFAETGVKDLLLFMVQLNQKFYNQEQVIRLTNEELAIRPDDIQGQFDLTVSSGAGMATKEATAMNLKTFLDTQIGLMGQGIQCVTQENIYEAMKKYLINLDYKNTDLFITEPAEVAMNEQLKMMAYQTLFSMLPPAFQMVVQEDLQRNGGQLSPQVIQGLFQLAPSLPPQGQQLVQILFGGQQQNALQQPNTGGSVGSQPTSPNGSGQSSKNLSGYLSQSGATADNKAFVQHDIN